MTRAKCSLNSRRLQHNQSLLNGVSIGGRGECGRGSAIGGCPCQIGAEHGSKRTVPVHARWNNMRKSKLLTAASVIAMIGAFGVQSIAQAAAQSPATVRTASTAVPQVPTCRLHQLRLRNGPRVADKTQQNTELFVLRNNSSRRCRLDGYPVVSLHTPHGLPARTLPFRYRDHGDQMLTNAKPHPVVLVPGGRAYFGINKQTCISHTTATARYIYIFPLAQLHQR